MVGSDGVRRVEMVKRMGGEGGEGGKQRESGSIKRGHRAKLWSLPGMEMETAGEAEVPLELRRSAGELGSSPSAPVANWSLRGKKAWKRRRNRAVADLAARQPVTCRALPHAPAPAAAPKLVPAVGDSCKGQNSCCR